MQAAALVHRSLSVYLLRSAHWKGLAHMVAHQLKLMDCQTLSVWKTVELIVAVVLVEYEAEQTWTQADQPIALRPPREAWCPCRARLRCCQTTKCRRTSNTTVSQ